MAIGYLVTRVQTREKPRSRKPRIYFEHVDETLFDRIDQNKLRGHASYFIELANNAVDMLGVGPVTGLRWRTDFEPELGAGYVVSNDWAFDILVMYKPVESLREYRLGLG